MRILTLFLILLFTKTSFAQYEGLCEGNMPSKNKKMIAYLKTKVGKNIGETDLIISSYKYAGIKYFEDHLGKTLYRGLDCIYPGDIIKFTKCNVKRNIKGEEVYMGYGCGTEYIIYKVKGEGEYQVIVQAEDDNGKVTATLLDFSLKNLTGEQPRFYRPGATK